MYHKIINGETIAEMQKMPAESVDLIFADPPYWMRTAGVLKRVEGTDYNGCDEQWDQFDTLGDYENFTRSWLSECRRLLKPDGAIWVIGGMQCIYTIGAIMQQLGFWIINDVIWHKKNPTPNFMGTRLNNSHETLIWAAKSRKSKYTFNYKTAKELNTDTVSESEYSRGVRKQMGSVWKISVCQGSERIKDENGDKLHSTQKPEELLYRVLAISSNREDVVLDPFGGTMTTAVMAKKLGRSSVMIEIDQKYCSFGQARLNATEYEDSPVANAVFDQKPPKASMADMISAGYFTAGEQFCLKDGQAVATLLEDGKLLYNGEEMDMHSCAAKARAVKAKRLNGFDVWYVMRNGQPTPISAIRADYRSRQQQNV